MNPLSETFAGLDLFFAKTSSKKLLEALRILGSTCKYIKHFNSLWASQCITFCFSHRRQICFTNRREGDEQTLLHQKGGNISTSRGYKHFYSKGGTNMYFRGGGN